MFQIKTTGNIMLPLHYVCLNPFEFKSLLPLKSVAKPTRAIERNVAGRGL